MCTVKQGSSYPQTHTAYCHRQQQACIAPQPTCQRQARGGAEPGHPRGPPWQIRVHHAHGVDVPSGAAAARLSIHVPVGKLDGCCSCHHSRHGRTRSSRCGSSRAMCARECRPSWECFSACCIAASCAAGGLPLHAVCLTRHAASQQASKQTQSEAGRRPHHHSKRTQRQWVDRQMCVGGASERVKECWLMRASHQGMQVTRNCCRHRACLETSQSRCTGGRSACRPTVSSAACKQRSIPPAVCLLVHTGACLTCCLPLTAHYVHVLCCCMDNGQQLCI
jgi:hypothetical protein